MQLSQSTDTRWQGSLLQMPSKESRQLVLKKSELTEGFQGKVFKDRVRKRDCGVYDQLVDIFLIGW